MLPYLVAFILLSGLIWAVMEWIYYRELHYQRECLRVQSIRLVTYWPGMESWRLAAERLANERPLAAPEVVPAAAEWQEPDMLPGSILIATEPDEPLKIVNITAALEASQQSKARAEASDAARSRLNEALIQSRPRRKGQRIRKVAN